jgi:hypothetical protein
MVLLAQFRFPDDGRPTPPPVVSPPLERLAARATYEELARTMAGVDRLVTPSTLVLEIQRDATVRDGDMARAAPALRIREDMVLVALQPGEEIVGVLGTSGPPPALVGRDDVVGLAAVRVPAAQSPTLAVASFPEAGTPARYVALVEASRSGPSVRPLFLGRLDPVTDVRWERPLMALGGMLTAQPGSFVFTLDAELVGLVVADGGLPALVPASLVLAASQDLAAGQSRHRGDFGIGWQRLTTPLARATGTTTGVVVGSVETGSPADTLLQPGDVVQAIDGEAIRSLADARLAEATSSPGETATLRVVRGSETLDLTLVSRQATLSRRPVDPEDLGLMLRSARNGLDIVRVTPGSAGDLAGLMTGDVITHIDREAAASPGRLRNDWAIAESGRTWLLVIMRSDMTLVLALVKP